MKKPPLDNVLILPLDDPKDEVRGFPEHPYPGLSPLRGKGLPI
jgi:hypothetical protein